jgi:hypothetical protein
MYVHYTHYSGSETIVKIDTREFIPMDPGNTDYQKYLAWVAEGNVANNVTQLPW